LYKVKRIEIEIIKDVIGFDVKEDRYFNEIIK